MVGLRPYGLLEVGIASVFNGLFLAFSLFDLAADVFAAASAGSARAAFLASYYAFRHTEPVVGRLVLALGLLLPYLLYTLISEDVRGLWLRPLQRRRHVVGVFMLASLVLVVAFQLLYQRPAEAALAAGAAGDAVDAVAVADAALRYHLATVLANLAVLPLPFFKASAAAEGEAAEATLAEAAAAAVAGARVTRSSDDRGDATLRSNRRG